MGDDMKLSILFGCMVFAFANAAQASDPLDPNLEVQDGGTATEPSQPDHWYDPLDTTQPPPTPQELPPPVEKPLPKVVPVVEAPRHHWGGLDFSVGVPSGFQVGLVVRPYVNWVRLEVGVGSDLIRPGVFGAITLDPFPWAFGLTATAEAGYYWSGQVPFITSNPPDVGYSYASLMPGLEFGPRNSVRFYLRGGFTWMHADVSDIDIGSNKGATIGNPSANFVAFPAVKLGLSVFF